MSAALAVLILDDDADVLKAARLAVSPAAARVDTLGSPQGLAGALEAATYDAVLLDMNFVLGEHSGREGLDALAAIQALDPTLSVVLMTTYGGVALAVEALKRGAVDFVLKPWRNDKLVTTLRTAADRTAAQRDARDLMNLDLVERRAIERALARFDGNISQAAAALGLTRPALYRRLEKHGL